MADSLINVTLDDGVAVVTLNRPDALNALSSQMRKELTDALLTLQSSMAVRVVIITGNGRAFCGGLDLNEMQAAGEEVARNGVIGREMLDALAVMECPVIAAVNGYAITGGLEIALCCDIIIASSTAQFADTHAKVGIVPAWGITQRLPRVIGLMRAKEMSLSGNKVSAQQAYEWGLVNRVVPPEALMDEALQLAREMVDTDVSAQTAIKSLIDIGWLATIEDGLEMEQAASKQAFREFSSSEDAKQA